MTKKLTLHYFNVKGLAEPIRYLLAYKQVDYTDHRFSREEWPQLKLQMPGGKAPVLDVDGKQLSQSTAILVYLANEHGLAGKGSWEIAKLQEVDGTIGDLQAQLSKWMHEQDAEKKKQIGEELRSKTIPESLRALEHIALLDQGNKFILGDSPAWTDFKLAVLTERLQEHASHMGQGSPVQISKALTDHLARIQSLPGVKEYIASRPQTDR